MSKDTSSDRERTAELMTQIEDRYLFLIRENYLDDPIQDALREYMADSLRKLMHTGRFSCVYDLASSRDWREAVVGLHYAIILASPAFDLARPGRPAPRVYQLLSGQVGDKYESDLKNSTSFVQPLAARPAFLLLILLKRRKVIIDFLAADRAVSDGTDVYAAALVSEYLTRGENVDPGELPAHDVLALRDRVVTRLRAQPWHDELAFAESERRFLQSWRYWTGQSTP